MDNNKYWKNVETLEHVYIAGRNLKKIGAAALENTLAVPQEVKHRVAL